MTRKATDFIIIHASYTPADMDIGVEEIRRWHVEERGWRDVGYHYVIRRNGTVEEGRGLDEQGAHAAGYNDRSLGVCMVGGMRDSKADCNFTVQQWYALANLVRGLKDVFPEAQTIGHRDVAAKECPTFDAKAWSKGI